MTKAALQILTIAVLGSLGLGSRAVAQADNPALRNSRDQLQAQLVEAEKILNSPGYSARIKQIKRQEIALLRSRLDEGDLQPGDQIILTVESEPALTNTFTVTPARAITLPGIADISLRGVLRSELESHLTDQLRRYLRNPVVHVQSTIRLSVLGSVIKPGFYQIDSDRMVGDAIMLAGGPATGIDPAKTQIERGGTVILDREAFTDALGKGKTLDQMNLRAGDEIVVGGGRTAVAGRSFLGAAVPVVSGLATLTYILVQIF